MTITHRTKSSGNALNAPESDDGGTGQLDDKDPPKYHCDACNNDVTNTVRIRCADKDCPDFDLCVTCFCSGVEPVKHKTWHAYRVVKPHNFPIFSDDWDADEELLLIEAAEKTGLGNWQAIADYVGTKSKIECEQHYLDVYVSSEDWPLPRMDLEFSANEDECRERKRQRLQLSRSAGRPKSSTPAKPVTSGPTFHEIQGYMPRRFEFETEHENDAEQSVKDMVFNDDDTQEEIDLKMMVLDIYNSRLDRRMERKQMIFDRGWLDFKKLQSAERRRGKDERELYNKTRVFCRLQTAEDYTMFVQGLVREQQLRERIATLQEWRQAGLTSLRQGEKYESDKQQRLAHLKTMAQLSNDRIHLNGLSQRSTYRQQLSALSPSNGASSYRDRSSSQSAGTNMASIAAVTTSGSASAAAVGGRKPANPLNIEDADGVHLLTPEEKTLCSALRIMPRPYLVIKDTILKEYAKQGFLKRRQARSLIKIDVNKTSRIYDFFVESGWIKAFRDPADDTAGVPLTPVGFQLTTTSEAATPVLTTHASAMESSSPVSATATAEATDNSAATTTAL